MANNKQIVYSNYSDSPPALKEFLYYMQTIKGLSAKTVEAYYIDLKLFLRFIYQKRNNCIDNETIENIVISNIDLDFIREISQTDILDFLYFVMQNRNNTLNTRSRKVSSIRSFFRYLTKKTNQLDNNPSDNIELPNNRKRLPKYLTLEQSIELLSNINTNFSERDYCIITLFLNCGMRLSELVGIDLTDIRDDTLRIIGKGDKERIIYLNTSCLQALNDYIIVRNSLVSPISEPALFISKKTKKRLTARRVQQIVDDCLKLSGLNHMGFSTHKLRHTAATLLYRTGNADMLALKEILGHEHVSTTEIYTHISDEAIKKAAKSSPLATFKKSKSDH